jgi:hypothetical protein
MGLIFKTKTDAGYDTEIGGVGTLGAFGKGGIPVERAAETMVELQDKKGKPLTGDALEKAAEAFAEARGIDTRSYKNIDEEKLRVEAGAFPKGYSIEEIATMTAERDRGYVAAHEAEPSSGNLLPSDVPTQEGAVLPQGSTPQNPIPKAPAGA